jgi:hypothetical protein
MWLRNRSDRRAGLLGPICLLGSVRLIATILHDRTVWASTDNP